MLSNFQALEAATRGVLSKKVFLEISQNSQENIVHNCFAVNFVKFLWTSFLQNTSGRLPLRPQPPFSKQQQKLQSKEK